MELSKGVITAERVASGNGVEVLVGDVVTERLASDFGMVVTGGCGVSSYDELALVILLLEGSMVMCCLLGCQPSRSLGGA